MKEPKGLLGKYELNKREVREVVIQNAEPASAREATEILVKNINSTYAKADLKQVADNATHLNTKERTELLRLIEYLEDLFDFTLVEWDTEPTDLDLNPGSKPFNSKYYQVPRIYKETFCKEIKRLVKIGMLTTVQQSQYGTPVFIIPKKERTVRFITEYLRLNQKLVRNPYPITRIGETMQQLEGFQYVTALYINTGYYTIRLSPASQDTETIVT